MTDQTTSPLAQTHRRQFHPDDAFRPTISVGREILPIAIQHGMELWWDGSTPTKRLDTRGESSKFTRFVNARIEGKLAEFAFTQLLEEYFDVSGAVDWRIYGDYTTTDDGDLQYLLDDDDVEYELGVDFDLKKTKPWNSWLAVREEIYEKIDDNAPVILSKLRIENDIQLDDWQYSEKWEDVDTDGVFRDRLLSFADEEFPIDVEFVGTVYKDEFTDYFKKGERLYQPQTGDKIGPELKRPNHGIHVDRLKNSPQRWNRVVAEICAEMPQRSYRPLEIIDRR